ncbi:uncharacterized protein K489DRAFT_384905 [Dissoconium aciculare CBS 342.82]|uniref:Uncharacterized protein n=1 Tax=Dissoconium aciculare CBS 342.82 TaxID=1314786 RepID=A0A6J3LRM7_9PEZI|nr:uncharacterized protein K489DRAFT_384905 [Dissoconium aciculare CBS 342.82]KAF1818480.1 hypothetical protein K489DRAFT_384905 [Dissoconium aciculare CBS 342.82]
MHGTPENESFRSADVIGSSVLDPSSSKLREFSQTCNLCTIKLTSPICIEPELYTDRLRAGRIGAEAAPAPEDSDRYFSCLSRRWVISCSQRGCGRRIR